MKREVAALALATLLTGGCGDVSTPHSVHRTVTLETIAGDGERHEFIDGIHVLTWEDLVPAGFHAAPGVSPVVEALDGQTVRLPGFVVPLEGRGQNVEEFLLVPYYGACIHVPPPPANQVVHVLAQGHEVRIRRLFDTVWVTGTLHVEHHSSRLAEAGYRLQVIEVTPYDG